MNNLRLTCIFVGIGIWLVPWFLYPASEAIGNSAAYGVVTTQVMYLPAEPFHITDMRYPDKSNFETRTVTIYQPYQNGQPLHDRPVIFFVHGGAWVDEYADWYTGILTPALTIEQGWVVVNVDYRLTSNQVFLADEHCPTYDTCDTANATKAAWYNDNIEDVAAAFEWTAQNIAAYGGDPQNIFLFGHSAGGYLVSLLATHDAYRALRGQMRGVISMSGVYNLNELDSWSYPHLDQTFLGGHTDATALSEASPGTYVVAGEAFPPFYVLHCEFDLTSLPEEAIVFRNKLKALGYAVD